MACWTKVELGSVCSHWQVAASAAFYDAVLAPIGGTRIADYGDVVGYGVPPRPDFWIAPRQTGEGFHESHIAFTAPDRPMIAMHTPFSHPGAVVAGLLCGRAQAGRSRR